MTSGGLSTLLCQRAPVQEAHVQRRIGLLPLLTGLGTLQFGFHGQG
jgi:hypothetical protein